jgi:hypothetical protein
MNVINATKACLQQMHVLSVMRHGWPAGQKKRRFINVKVFLASFMVVYQTDNVFERMGPLEEGLLQAARPLLARVLAICDAVCEVHAFAKVPAALTRDFNTLLFAYIEAFYAWKAPDEQKLCQRIGHQLTACYASLVCLSPQSERAESLTREVERLRAMLKSIGGQKALAQFDAEVRVEPASTRVEDPKKARWELTEEQVDHELLLDPTFRFEREQSADLVSVHFRKAFWDSIVGDLTLPTPCYVRVLKVLTEIRNTGPLLDMDHIEQQAYAGEFASWDRCVSLMRTIESCFSNDEVLELLERAPPADAREQAERFCHGLQLLHGQVRAYKLGEANLRLDRRAAVIQRDGVHFERERFKPASLDHTRAWLQRQVRVQPQLHAALVEGSATALAGVHREALLDLLFNAEDVECPETLALDRERIAQMREDLQAIALSMTESMVTKVATPAQLETAVARCKDPTHPVRCIM